jgi:hypothetical protein
MTVDRQGCAISATRNPNMGEGNGQLGMNLLSSRNFGRNLRRRDVYYACALRTGLFSALTGMTVQKKKLGYISIFQHLIRIESCNFQFK